MLARAHISLWQREEDGSYQAEMNGWKLHVTWITTPPKGGPHGFAWSATGPGDEKVKGEELVEEIEVAMMDAEKVATHGQKDTNEGGAGLSRSRRGGRFVRRRRSAPCGHAHTVAGARDLWLRCAERPRAGGLQRGMSSLIVMGIHISRILVAAPLRV